MLGAMSGVGHQREDERDPDAGLSGAARPHAPSVNAAQGLASTVGNRGFGALLARSGDGIMADGTVHPDVEATIARAQGGGQLLDAGVRERLAPELGDSLEDVRVHTDPGADALARSVSARAFTTGSDVFFASGEYRPGSREGEHLLAHELCHVVQQRGATDSGPLTVSEPHDALESEAEAVARELTG